MFWYIRLFIWHIVMTVCRYPKTLIKLFECWKFEWSSIKFFDKIAFSKFWTWIKFVISHAICCADFTNSLTANRSYFAQTLQQSAASDTLQYHTTSHKIFSYTVQWRIQDFIKGEGVAPLVKATNLLLPPANEVCEGYVGYVFTPVCQSFCSQGGGSASVHAGIADTPGSRQPPQEQIPPLGADTPPPQEQIPPPQWEIRPTSGRYASYWNAYLFGKSFAQNCMKMKEFGPGEPHVPSIPLDPPMQ